MVLHGVQAFRCEGSEENGTSGSSAGGSEDLGELRRVLALRRLWQGLLGGEDVREGPGPLPELYARRGAAKGAVRGLEMGRKASKTIENLEKRCENRRFSMIFRATGAPKRPGASHLVSGHARRR